MSNPFLDEEDQPSERLWYREIPDAGSGKQSRRPFEPAGWSSSENADNSNWINPIGRIGTPPRRETPALRFEPPDWSAAAQERPSHSAIQFRNPSNKSCISSFSALLVFQFLLVLAATGYQLWSSRQHQASTTAHLQTLQGALSDIKSDVNNTQIQLEALIMNFNKLQYAFNNVNDTSNLGVLNSMKRMKQELLSEMNSTRATVRNDLTASEAKVNSLVSSTGEELERMKSNVSNIVTNMNKNMNRTVQRLNSLVSSAKAAIDLEVKNMSLREEKYVIDTQKQFEAENNFVKYELAGTFSLLSCLISLWDITSHLRHYNKPEIQRRVCAILWMVPVYSVTSWLALIFPSMSTGLGAFRDCYEAYAIYTFIGFLIAIISNEGGIKDAITALAEEEADESGSGRQSPQNSVDHYSEKSLRRQQGDAIMVSESTQLITDRRIRIPSYASLVDVDELSIRSHSNSNRGAQDKAKALRPPFSCFLPKDASPRYVASAVIHQCQAMAMQFVFIKPILAMMPTIFYLLHKPYESVPPLTDTNQLNWNSPQLYVYAVENLSVMIAFYGLLSFYYATEKLIAMYMPWPKFLCIKGVVFVTFWQSIGIDVMCSFDMSTPEQASQIQNFLICIEMLLASLAHYYIFPYEEWQDDYLASYSKRTRYGFHDSLAFGDFASDMRRLVTNKAWDTATPVSDTAQAQSEGQIVKAANSEAGLIAPRALQKSPPSQLREGPSLSTPRLDELELASSPGDIFGSVVKSPKIDQEISDWLIEPSAGYNNDNEGGEDINTMDFSPKSSV